MFVPSSIEPFTGYRYYSFEQIFDAKMILKLKDLGLSLEEIKEFLQTNDMDILFNKQNEYKEKINNLKKYINKRNILIIDIIIIKLLLVIMMILFYIMV